MNKIDALIIIVMSGAAVGVAGVSLLHVLVQVRVWMQMRTLHDLLVGKTPNAKMFAALSKDKKREVVNRALQLAVAAVNRISTVGRDNDLTVEVSPMAKGKRDGSAVEYTLTGAVLGEGDCTCQSCTMKRIAERSGFDVGEINFEGMGVGEGHRSVH